MTDTKRTNNFEIDRDLLGDEPERHTVTRDGDRNLAFRGWRLGHGEYGSGGTSGYSCDWNRGTKTSIYLTTGGNIVVQVHRWSCRQGERDRDDAAICRSIDEVLAWLRRDNHGELGHSAKRALDDARWFDHALSDEEVK